jgi:hypothetical protein
MVTTYNSKKDIPTHIIRKDKKYILHDIILQSEVSNELYHTINYSLNRDGTYPTFVNIQVGSKKYYAIYKYFCNV